MIRLQEGFFYGDVGVIDNGVEAADMVGMGVCAEYEIESYLTVFVLAVLQKIIANLLLIALEIKPRLVGRKIGILCGVYHSVVRIAFENNAVAVTGV